jgi:alkylation response protein AidB-like acyl-CoA dehydrogenase
MTTETIDEFEARARVWALENLTLDDPDNPPHFEDDLEDWNHQREMQKKIWAGGFAGIGFPTAYGGLGLSTDYQAAFNRAVAGRRYPSRLNVPSFSIVAPVILDFGTEDQKQFYIRGALKGEIVLSQFLSEPKGGSDLAGVISRADRDGDTWVLNGSKIWSTAAYGADYGIALVRTDWDAPKHRGLSMILVPIKEQPGFTLNRIRMVTAHSDFCEEFFEDLILPLDALVGQENDGWTVASRQLVYERTAVGGSSPYTQGPRMQRAASNDRRTPAELAKDLGKQNDPFVQDRVAAARTREVVHQQVSARIARAIVTGALPPTAASIIRLSHAEVSWTDHDVLVDIAGGLGVAPNGPSAGALTMVEEEYLMRQGGSLGGGSTEMARNIISERVLGMPREFAADRDVAFREVRSGR